MRSRRAVTAQAYASLRPRRSHPVKPNVASTPPCHASRAGRSLAPVVGVCVGGCVPRVSAGCARGEGGGGGERGAAQGPVVVCVRRRKGRGGGGGNGGQRRGKHARAALLPRTKWLPHGHGAPLFRRQHHKALRGGQHRAQHHAVQPRKRPQARLLGKGGVRGSNHHGVLHQRLCQRGGRLRSLRGQHSPRALRRRQLRRSRLVRAKGPIHPVPPPVVQKPQGGSAHQPHYRQRLFIL